MKKVFIMLVIFTILIFCMVSASALDVFVDGAKVPFTQSSGYPFMQRADSLEKTLLTGKE